MESINLHIRLRSMFDLMWDHIAATMGELGAAHLKEDMKCRVNELRYSSEEEFWLEMENIYVVDEEADEEEVLRSFVEVKDMVRGAVLLGTCLLYTSPSPRD